MRVPIQWAADTECSDCKGTGFREHRVYVEDMDGYSEVAEVFRVVCSCVVLREPLKYIDIKEDF